MGININNIPNKPTTVPDASLVYVGTPGGVNPDPFTDGAPTKANFLKEDRARLTDLESDVNDIQGDIQELQNGSTKRLFNSQTTTITFTQNTDSVIEKFFIKVISGSPSIAIGFAAYPDAGYNDIDSDTLENGFYSLDVTEYSDTSRSIYINMLNGGSIDAAVFSKESLFTPI